uniref:Uncharacterized protein n=1 Tax=Anopheles minimus TaxID=112268 RepID=A0A182WNN4_9DIPT
MRLRPCGSRAHYFGLSVRPSSPFAATVITVTVVAVVIGVRRTSSAISE